jgi:hypothetical protein
MKDLVGLSSGRVIHLTMWTMTGALVAVYFWGWMADRFGGKPVIITGLFFNILLPVLWYIIPRGQAQTGYIVSAIIWTISGIMSSAFGVGLDRYLFLTAVPPEKKTTYFSVWHTWNGVFGGLGPILAGRFLNLCGGLNNATAAGLRIDSYTPFFGIYLILSIATIVVLGRLKPDSEISTGEFVGMLFQGRPFGAVGAVGSVMRYHWAAEENERIVTTRKIGESDSPLSTGELVEALKDPSFDVRYEAIVAMSRRRPDRKIVSALLDVLNGSDIELSATAAWALGQIGDRDAIPALRKQLSAPYRILRARSARALGSLGDIENAAELLNLFTIETDPVLKTAYASALSTLRYLPALEQILKLLAEVQNETFRRELALAAARIIGSERTYIKLWRSAEADWATAVSQAVLRLKKPITRLRLEMELMDAIQTCADSFAADKPGWGVELLWPILDSIPKDSVDNIYRKIFAECSRRLEQFGSARREYVLLGIHTCDVMLRARCAAWGRQSKSTALKKK